jgi:hypothetical protein
MNLVYKAFSHFQGKNGGGWLDFSDLARICQEFEGRGVRTASTAFLQFFLAPWGDIGRNRNGITL